MRMENIEVCIEQSVKRRNERTKQIASTEEILQKQSVRTSRTQEHVIFFQILGYWIVLLEIERL